MGGGACFIYGLFGGRAIAQEVSHRPLTAEVWVRAGVSPRGICGGPSGTGTGFSPSSSVSPVAVTPLWLSTPICHLGDEK
jgi:hypothetical protein